MYIVVIPFALLLSLVALTVFVLVCAPVLLVVWFAGEWSRYADREQRRRGRE